MPRRDLAAPTASLSFLAPEPNPTPVMVFRSTSRCPARPGHVSHSPGGRSSPQPARSSTAMVTWDNSPPGSSNSTPQPHPGPTNLVTNGDQASVRLRTVAADIRAVLMRGIVVRAGPELVVCAVALSWLAACTAAADYRSGVQLVPFGPGQAGRHQLVRMINQVKQFILGYRAGDWEECWTYHLEQEQQCVHMSRYAGNLIPRAA